MIKYLILVLTPLIFSANSNKVIFDKVNLTRTQLGVPAFIWDERLARVAREAVANNWAYHEGFW